MKEQRNVPRALSRHRLSDPEIELKEGNNYEGNKPQGFTELLGETPRGRRGITGLVY